jgi:hypothetical protein
MHTEPESESPIAEAALQRETTRACELISEHLVLTMKIIVEGLALDSPKTTPRGTTHHNE